VSEVIQEQPLRNQSYAIDNLREHPEWVGEIASWHHQEWLKGYTSSHRLESLSSGDLAGDVREREHNLRSHFSSNTVPTTFVAYTDSVVMPQAIGSVSIVYYQFSKHRKPSEWITNLYVCEAWRCRGVGEALLNKVLNYAQSHQITQVRLYTRDKEDYYLKRNWQLCHKGVVQGNAVSVLIRMLELMPQQTQAGLV